MSEFIFDISKEEENYLIKENISKKKFVFTHTPIEFKKKYPIKKRNLILFFLVVTGFKIL